MYQVLDRVTSTDKF